MGTDKTFVALDNLYSGGWGMGCLPDCFQGFAPQIRNTNPLKRLVFAEFVALDFAFQSSVGLAFTVTSSVPLTCAVDDRVQTC